MKKKSVILTVSAVIVATMVGVTVACTKDAAKQNVEENHAVPSKTSTVLMHLAQDARNFWEKCDSAYRADSVYFMYLCQHDDIDGFIQYIDLPDGLLDDFNYWLSAIPLQQSMEDEEETEDICHVCLREPLSGILEAEQLRQVFSVQFYYQVATFQMWRDCMNECVREILNNVNKQDICIINCMRINMLEYYLINY